MLIVLLCAMAAIHFLRPDLSGAVIDFICQKYHALTPAFIPDGIAMAQNLLQDLSAHLLGINYYGHAVGFLKGLVYWSAFVERAFVNAGYPELAYWAGIGVYIGALAVVVLVLAVIWWLLNIVWAVIAGLFRIVFTVLAWVFYPLRFVFGLFHRLFHRLFFRRNARPVAPGPGVH